MIRRSIFLLVVLILFIGVVAFLAYRPATVTGVDAKQLASSLEGSVGGSDSACVQVRGAHWRCHVRTGKPQRVARYRLVTKSLGCWDGTLATAGPGASRRPSGCITILDYL